MSGSDKPVLEHPTYDLYISRLDLNGSRRLGALPQLPGPPLPHLLYSPGFSHTASGSNTSPDLSSLRFRCSICRSASSTVR